MFLACAPVEASAAIIHGRAMRPGRQGTFDLNSDGRSDFTIGTKAVVVRPDTLAVYFAIEQPGNAVQNNGALTDGSSVPAIGAGTEIGPNAMPFSWDDSFSDLNIPGVSPADGMVFLPPQPHTQFIGVRFHASDGLHYGWIQLAQNRWGPYDFNHPNWPEDPSAVPNFELPRIDTFEIGVIDWAYESTPGAAIVAGAVPEAGRVVLGVAAMVMVVLRRRRAVRG
jgi:hypothetical protein